MTDIAPFPASNDGILAAYVMGNERSDIDGITYAKIWTFTVRKDAVKEQHYWLSRGHPAIIRPAARGFTLYAAPSTGD